MQIRRQLSALLLTAGLSFSSYAADSGILAEYNYYESGKIELNAGNYQQAITHFINLQKLYPNSPYIPQAKLESAYAHYKLGEAQAAIDLLQEFLLAENKHPQKPYAFYLAGLARYQQALDLMDSPTSAEDTTSARTATQQAIGYFTQLLDTFPGSQYGEDIGKKTTYLLEKLVQQRIKLEKKDTDRSRLQQIQVESDQAIVWLLKQPANQYTLQLVRSPDYNTTFMVSLQYKLEKNAFIIETQTSDGTGYTLLYGVYPSKNEALQAGANLPQAILETQPLVRELSSVQTEIVDSRVIAGDSTLQAPPPTTAEAAPASQEFIKPPPTNSTTQMSDEEWLLSQHPMDYTVQLLGAPNEASLTKFINDHNLAGQTVRYRSLRRDGSSWYSLLYGSYPDNITAIEAARQIGISLRIDQPWIRRFQSVQNEIDSSKSSKRR